MSLSFCSIVYLCILLCLIVFVFNRNTVDGPTRLQRLAAHMIAQQSFYPLFPAPEGVHVDFSHHNRFAFTRTPDILISPSKTRFFAAEVSTNMIQRENVTTPLGTSSVIVNPEYLTKGASGGTYALISIHPMRDDELTSESENVQGDKVKDLKISSRTRVDIIKV